LNQENIRIKQEAQKLGNLPEEKKCQYDQLREETVPFRHFQDVSDQLEGERPSFEKFKTNVNELAA
jgi:hypothetical protein